MCFCRALTSTLRCASCRAGSGAELRCPGSRVIRLWAQYLCCHSTYLPFNSPKQGRQSLCKGPGTTRGPSHDNTAGAVRQPGRVDRRASTLACIKANHK
jgi:hypothetical protein